MKLMQIMVIAQSEVKNDAFSTLLQLLGTNNNGTFRTHVISTTV